MLHFFSDKMPLCNPLHGAIFDQDTVKYEIKINCRITFAVKAYNRLAFNPNA